MRYEQNGKIFLHQSKLLMFYADFTGIDILHVNIVTTFLSEAFQQQISIYRNKQLGNRVQITSTQNNKSVQLERKMVKYTKKVSDRIWRHAAPYLVPTLD